MVNLKKKDQHDEEIPGDENRSGNQASTIAENDADTKSDPTKGTKRGAEGESPSPTKKAKAAEPQAA